MIKTFYTAPAKQANVSASGRGKAFPSPPLLPSNFFAPFYHLRPPRFSAWLAMTSSRDKGVLSRTTEHGLLKPFNLRMISIKFLFVISILCKAEWSWELQTWSHKIYLLDISSTFPHYFYRKWGQQMRIQILILGFKGLTPGTYIIHSQVQIREQIFFERRKFLFFLSLNSSRD